MASGTLILKASTTLPPLARVNKCSTHHDLEVVAGHHHLPVLGPAHGGRRAAYHIALHFDVHRLVGVQIGRGSQEAWRHCGQKGRVSGQTPLQVCILSPV